jgi:hypothetical protein
MMTPTVRNNDLAPIFPGQLSALHHAANVLKKRIQDIIPVF